MPTFQSIQQSAHAPRSKLMPLRYGAAFVSTVMLLLALGGCTTLPAVEMGARQISRRVHAQLSRPPIRTPDNSQADEPMLGLAAASTNRLLVTGVDGNLFTVAPDGGNRFYLTKDASPQHIYTQPTWSSTGERIAWSTLARVDGDVQATLVTALANGTVQTVIPVLFPPFYLSWSPDSSKLAYLSNWLGNSGPTIALHVADLNAITASGNQADPAVDVTPVGIGQPFYFSWSPASDHMVAHIGNQAVLVLDLTKQESTVLVEESANFAAPQWFNNYSTDGTGKNRALLPAGTDGLLYVTLDGNMAQLVASDSNGENVQPITPLARQSSLSFSLNATGDHLAFIETTDLVGFNAFGPLFLYDLENEYFQQISTAPAIAFFWSPSGSALYFLTVEPEGDELWLRVNVWDGNTVHRFARFIPNPTFAQNYLPFADQYMQSLRFWSPDSHAIVYTGQAEDGTAGVWVQPVEEGKVPFLAAVGTFATWSPR